MLTERDVANDGVAPIKNNDYKTVSNKPAEAYADANAKWVAAAKPHVVANSERIARRNDAVELSAATTHEGHDMLKREVEKAMKNDRPAPAPTKVRVKVKKQKEAGSHIML